jgi:hypothetical protein
MELNAETDRALARLQAQSQRIEKLRSRKGSQTMMNKALAERVQEMVVRNKAALFEYWSAVDKSPRGVFLISAAVWREGCSTILDNDLPWVKLQHLLDVTDDEKEVHYIKFLTKYRVAFEADYGLLAAGWEQAVCGKIMETLLKADLPLREAYAALDATNDGMVW